MKKKIVGFLPDIIKHSLINNVKEKSGIERTFYAIKKEYIEIIKKTSKNSIIPINIISSEENIYDYINLIDGLVIPGGADIPAEFYGEKNLETSIPDYERYKFELNFIKHFIQANKPIIGICAGMQSINVALGGKMNQYKPNHQLPSGMNLNEHNHEIEINQNSKLFKILNQNKIIVNSAHKQTILEENIPSILNISSKSSDGEIESIEIPSHKFCIGLQWHPEQSQTENDLKIFKAFSDLL